MLRIVVLCGTKQKTTRESLIEVGLWRGGTGVLIAKRVLLVGIMNRVFLCDIFKGVVKAYEKDNEYKGGSMQIHREKKSSIS